MFVVDSLLIIGMASASLGTIHEANGPVEHTFWFRNDGNTQQRLVQSYTSCGCTTIRFDGDSIIDPHDSLAVTLHFTPKGKGGDFEETGTVVAEEILLNGEQGAKKILSVTLTGTCITSEETLLRQFPIRVSDSLRLSTDHFDLGIMHVGETKQRTVVLLHRDDGDRQEPVTITFTPSAGTPKGLQHINYPLFPANSTRQDLPSIGKTEGGLTIRLDVLIK